MSIAGCLHDPVVPPPGVDVKAGAPGLGVDVLNVGPVGSVRGVDAFDMALLLLFLL